ncbi:glycogen debranching enzyme family protein [Candidatus Sumerlaeota bacterium]|nr:glycogen debranching enzyme family protein [Candidatus Sumerlaeota bacterium]
MNPIVEIEAEYCQDAEAALQKEWFVANSLGGYASSTLLCCNTRKYHGLLVYPSHPPLGRMMILSRIEERLILDGETYHLSPSFTSDGEDITGNVFLVNFKMDPFPLFTYAIGDWEIEKRIILRHEKNCVSIKYRVLYGNGKASLTLIPFLCFRGIHALQNPNPDLTPILRINDPRKIIFQFGPEGNEFCFIHNAREVSPEIPVEEEFEYPVEKERGYDSRESLFRICEFQYNLSGEESAYLTSGSGNGYDIDPSTIRPDEVHRHRVLWRKTVEIHPEKKDDPVLLNLMVAADVFIVRQDSEYNVMAGYPWHSIHSRDALISFPGLFLSSGRYEEARLFLLSMIRRYRDGLFPDHFLEDGGYPNYNTVDSSLWFINCVYEYFIHTKDAETIRTPFFDVVKDIIHNYVSGTHFNIRQEKNGMISSGEEGWQITWMNSSVEGKAVTPRIGKNVEINALWYHALRVAAYIADALDDEELYAAYEIHAEKARASFEETFWNEEGGYLFDTIGKESPDSSIRPNQIFAISLRFPVINNSEKAGKIFDCVTRHLLTPFGLRTLAPGHPDYKPRYRGDQSARDFACHQGTVWPWLTGAYIDALLNVKGCTEKTLGEARALLDPLIGHINDAGLGSISEIFDGDPPHAPRGAIAYAASVGEILRSYMKILDKKRRLAADTGVNTPIK